MGSFDPTMMFDRMSGGKPTIDANTYQSRWDPQAGQKMREFLSKKGISNGQMTKDLFGEYMKEQMAARMAGGGGGMGGFGRGDRGDRGGPPGAGGPPGMMFNAGNGGPPGFGGAPGMMAPQANPEEMAREKFKQYDKNSDGILQADEQPDEMKAEMAKFDGNKNSQIEFEEYKEFFKSQMTALMNQGPAGGYFAPPAFEDELEKKPTVFRAGKLPKNLPDWFEKLDKDKDAQVGLYEWKSDGRALDDFRNLDFNGDGFITIDECLRNSRILAKKAGVSLPSGDSGASASGEKKDAGSWANFFKGRGGDKGKGREEMKTDGGRGGRGEKGERGERPERSKKGD